MARHKIFIIIFSLIHVVVTSQSSRILGDIYDIETDQPIAYATIEVFNDSMLVGGTTADSSGFFQINLVYTWTYLKVSFMGYKNLRLTASEVKSREDLSIALSRAAELLEEVIVSEKRTSTELKKDRKIINFNSKIRNSGINALEAFDYITEVEVDIPNNKISLRGNDNVQILVNGKPSPLAGVEILNQMSTSSIDRVEIITSPSAKYRSNGIAGVINIILKKEEDRGLNLTTFANTGTRRYGFATSINYGTSIANYRLNASRAQKEETNIQNITRQFDHGLLQKIFTPYGLIGGVNKIAVGVDLFLHDRHELSVGLDYTDDNHSYNNESRFMNLSGPRAYTYLRKNEHSHKTIIFDTNYRLKFKKSQHFLEFDYQINDSKNSYPFEDYQDDILLQKQYLSEDFTIQSIAVDYVQPLSEGSRIETGLFYNTQVLESQLSQVTVDHSLHDLFDYNESLWGIYGLYNFTPGAWQIQSGLRVERFNMSSIIQSGVTRRSTSLTNLFPSLNLSYRPDDYYVLTFGYSRRIERPNFHHTNAFQLVNPLFDWEYNPDIIPETSHNLDWSFQRFHDRWNMSLSGFYRNRNDVILWRALANESRPIFRYENSGTFQSYGIEFTLKYKLLHFWDVSLSTNYYLDRLPPDLDVSWDKNYSSGINLKNTFRLNKKLTFDLVHIQVHTRQTAFTRVQGRNRLDIFFNGSFVNGRLSLGVRMVDIFDQNIIKSRNQTVGLLQHTQWNLQYQTRSVLISLNYKISDKKVKRRNEKSRKYNKPLID